MFLPQGSCVLAFNVHGQLLLVTRPGRSDRVCLPGGKLEAGETFLEAAVRELREETGLLAPADRLVQVFRAPCVGDGGAPWFDVACFALLDFVDAVPGPEESDLEARFDAPRTLLDGSPFADYNRDALRALCMAAPVLSERGDATAAWAEAACKTADALGA